MIKITIIIEGGLKDILPKSQHVKSVTFQKPVKLREALDIIGISSELCSIAIINNMPTLSLEKLIDKDSQIRIFPPLSGG